MARGRDSRGYRVEAVEWNGCKSELSQPTALQRREAYCFQIDRLGRL